MSTVPPAPAPAVRSPRGIRRRAQEAALCVRRSAWSAVGDVGSPRREIAIVAGALGLYTLVRAITAGSREAGLRNAARIVRLERSMGVYVEPALQSLIRPRGPLTTAWSVMYVASQTVVLPFTLFSVYRHRRASYPFVRNLAFLSWSAGVAWYALQPVAPPRLMPELGFRDTVSENYLDLAHPLMRAFYNEVAAMPSLHVGMAPVVGWALWSQTSNPLAKASGILYPAVVATCVLVTGNHWVLDIVAGAGVVAGAALLARRVTPPSAGRRRAAAARTTGSAGGAAPRLVR